MEMEYQDPSRRGRFIMLFGVILAIVAGAAAFFLLNNAQQQGGSGTAATAPVVVAIRDIPARKPIEAGDVIVRDVPIDKTNEKGVFSTLELVLGRVLAVPALEGQLVTSNMLASTTTGGQFSILDPTETIAPDSEAWRAISLTVTDDRAVGGILEAGNTVDVFVTATVNVPQDLIEQGRYYTDKSTKVTYQNMVILARTGTFYILKATLLVAEEIAHLQATGNAQFSFALRPEIDVRIADVSGLGETTNRLITKYGLPIPETYPAGAGPVVTPPPIVPPTPAPEPSPSPSPSPSATP